MSTPHRSVYLSYAWGGESERVVDALDADLRALGIAVVRDKRDLGYKGSIRDFMKRIGSGQAVVMVISDKYLKSPNCMFELLEVARNVDVRDRIFPVLLEDARIHDPVSRVGYVKHWEDQIKALDDAMRSVSAANLQGLREEIDSYNEIRHQVAGLTFLLKDMNTLTAEMHENTTFSSLIAGLHARLSEAPGAVEPVPVAPRAALLRTLARLGAPASTFRRPRLELEFRRQLLEGPLRAVVVHGLPGVGKTALVCQGLADLGDKLGDVLALRLDGPAGLEPGYALEEINDFLQARHHGLDPQRLANDSAERVLGQLVEALAASSVSPPLLVLDGGEFTPGSWPAMLLQALLRSPLLKLVVSSRDRILSAAQAHFVMVPPLDDTEGPAFIRHWAGILGLELDAGQVWAQLHRLPRSHPQALATLVAQLADVPLEMLLESETHGEAETPARLVERIVSALSPEAREALAFSTLLSNVDIASVLSVLELRTPKNLALLLATLLARSLVRRSELGYEVPELVAQALARADPQALGCLAERAEASWLAARAAQRHLARTDVFARFAPTVAHRLCALGLAAPVRRMLEEGFLELLNQRGFWKEYAVLVKLAHDAARDQGDRAAQFRLACRLVRKQMQTGERDRARAGLAELEGLTDASASDLERAELHSHRALIHQMDGDEAAVERELEASYRLREAIDDRPGMAMIDKQLGHLLLRGRQFPASAQRLAAASLAFAALGDVKNHLEAETSLGLCELRVGALEEADARLRRTVAECRSGGYEAGLPRALFHLCLAAERLGHVAEALGHARESVRLAEACGNVLLAQMAQVAAGRLAELPRGRT
jgi:Tfp pilus assembly protein PilF